MTIKWRSQVQQSDVVAIRRIVTESGVFSAEEIDVACELAEDRITHGVQSDYHFIFADQENQLLGYTSFGRIPLTDERYDLYWIVVNKHSLQRGIASALSERTDAAIRALGGKAVYAETSSRIVYAPAQKFYLKQGYSEVARLGDFYAADDDKIIYAKRL